MRRNLSYDFEEASRKIREAHTRLGNNLDYSISDMGLDIEATGNRRALYVTFKKQNGHDVATRIFYVDPAITAVTLQSYMKQGAADPAAQETFDKPGWTRTDPAKEFEVGL